MPLAGLLNCLHNSLVDSERYRGDKSDEWQIGNHTDQGEHWHGQKNARANAKGNGRLLHIAPVDQGLN